MKNDVQHGKEWGYDQIDLTLFPQSFHFSELDVWRATLSQEADSDAKRAVHTIASDGAVLKDVGNIRAACRVVPLPTMHQMKRCAAAAASATSSESSELLSAPCVWLAEQSCPSIRVLDLVTKNLIMSIENPKAGCFPTAIAHAPCTTLFRRKDLTPIDVRGRLEDFAALVEKDVLQFDFVWVGFSDGSLRLFYTTGNERRGSSSVVNCNESDFFFVYELPKSHVAAITGFALPPAHYANKNCGLGSACEDGSRAALAAQIFNYTPAADAVDHLGLICTASSDSCAAVWNATEIYKEIAALHLGQERLQERARLAAGGEKWQRLIGTQGRHVEGLERSGEPVQFQIFDISGDRHQSVSTFSYCAKLKTRYLMKLKGSVAGIRSIRWVSTCVMASAARADDRKSAVLVAKQAQAAESLLGDGIEEDEGDDCPIFPIFQTDTRAQRRDNRRKSLNLTEEQMAELDVKQDRQYTLQQQELQKKKGTILPETPLISEPSAASRTVHFLICGDDCGYVMIWHLDDELNKKNQQLPTAPARQVSPTPSMRTIGDARSVATKAPKTDSLTRSTDKKILFTGGVPISGLAVMLPPVVYLPERTVEENDRSVSPSNGGAGNDHQLGETGRLLAPRNHPLRALASLGDTISESAALFHAYENLELVVAVEGSVQFLSCHPTKPHEETDEDLQRLVKQAVQSKQQAIQSRRADENELVGSLDFPSFSVYFAKRVLEFMPQPVTNMFYDRKRQQVWVSRCDGVTHIYSSLSLRIIARVMNPSASTVVDPPHYADILLGIAQYSGKGDLPSGSDLGKDISSKGYVSNMLMTDCTTYTRFVASFADKIDHSEISKYNTEIVALSNAPLVLSAMHDTEEELAKQIAAHRVKQIQREESVCQEKQQSFEQKVITARSTLKLDSAREWFGSIEIGLSWINRWKEITTSRKAKRLSDLDNGSRLMRRHRAHFEGTELHIHILQSIQAFTKRQSACSAVLEMRWRAAFLGSFFVRWESSCTKSRTDRRFSRNACMNIIGRRFMLTAGYYHLWQSVVARRKKETLRIQLQQDEPRIRQALEAAQLRQRCFGLCETQHFQNLMRNDYCRVRLAGIASVARLLCADHFVSPAFHKWAGLVQLRRKEKIARGKVESRGVVSSAASPSVRTSTEVDVNPAISVLEERFDEWSVHVACLSNTWESLSWAEWTSACYVAHDLSLLNHDHFERKKELERVGLLLEDREQLFKHIQQESAVVKCALAEETELELPAWNPRTLQRLVTVVDNVKKRLPLDCAFEEVLQQEAASSFVPFPVLNAEDDIVHDTGSLAASSQQVVFNFFVAKLRQIFDGFRTEGEAVAADSNSSPNTKTASAVPARFVLQAIQLCDYLRYASTICRSPEGQRLFAESFDAMVAAAGLQSSADELSILVEGEAARLYPVQPLAATLRRHASPQAPPPQTVGQSTAPEPQGKGKKNRRHR